MQTNEEYLYPLREYYLMVCDGNAFHLIGKIVDGEVKPMKENDQLPKLV